MSDYNPIKDLGLTCPYGGIFYICADDPDRFIGCCTINPCGARKGLCPDKSLRSASFNATLRHEFLPQACINDNVDVSWYACVGEALPFLGCCAVDPCLRGICLQRDLRAAKLSDKAKNAQDFLDGDPEYMPRPTSSALEGSGISSSSLCASSTTAMTTMISSFITSFATETTIATITSTATTTTSVMTILPTEAPDAPPVGPKGHGSNTKLAWLVVIPITLFLWYCVWKYRCIPRCRAKLSKGRPEQRDEQEHQHEQQQQQEHERNPNATRTCFHIQRTIRCPQRRITGTLGDVQGEKATKQPTNIHRTSKVNGMRMVLLLKMHDTPVTTKNMIPRHAKWLESTRQRRQCAANSSKRAGAVIASAKDPIRNHEVHINSRTLNPLLLLSISIP